MQDLAQAVRERRRTLSFTQNELATRTGLNVATIRRIEQVGQDGLRSQSLRVLDDALGWQRGSAMGLLRDGQDPRIAAGPLQAAERVADMIGDARALAVGRAVLALLDALTAERIT